MEFKLSNKSKEPKEDLSLKPISELTEDEIIKIGLKQNTKKDMICYMLMGLMILMIFVPPVFRVIFYDPDLAISEKEVVYMTLDCVYASGKGNYVLYKTIKINYKDSVALNAELAFLYRNKKVTDIPDPMEVTKYLNVQNANLQKIEDPEGEDGYKFVMDFEKNPALKNVTELKEYAYAAPTQITNMNNLRYNCNTTSETRIQTYRGDTLIKEEPVEKKEA